MDEGTATSVGIDFARAVGCNLRKARQASGLSIEEISRRAGFKPATLTSWERCDRIPAVEKIQRVAEVYGLKFVDLIPVSKHHSD